MIFPYVASSNFKQKTSLRPPSKISHLDANKIYATSPSIVCTHNILNITHRLDQVQTKKLCPNPTPMCNLFPMEESQQIDEEPTNRLE